LASGRETESRRRLHDADLLPGRQVKRYHPLGRLFRLQLLLDLVRDLGGGGRPDPLQSEKLAASHRENFNGKDRAPLHSSSSSSSSSSGSCRRRTSAATEWSRVLSRRILDVVCSYSNGTPYGPVVKSFASLDHSGSFPNLIAIADAED
jgi:hypothetical protein